MQTCQQYGLININMTFVYLLEAQGFDSGDNYHGVWGTRNWLINACFIHLAMDNVRLCWC